jgi:Tfp pilus assembly protein PilE
LKRTLIGLLIGVVAFVVLYVAVGAGYEKFVDEPRRADRQVRVEEANAKKAEAQAASEALRAKLAAKQKELDEEEAKLRELNARARDGASTPSAAPTDEVRALSAIGADALAKRTCAAKHTDPLAAALCAGEPVRAAPSPTPPPSSKPTTTPTPAR